MPVLRTDGGEGVGGILAPVVPNSPQSSIVLQGLALLGIRQNKAHICATCVLNWVAGDERDVLLAMGFDVLDAWEELSSSSERVSLLPSGVDE
jgi:beta-N-acetylhexosaminidase